VKKQKQMKILFFSLIPVGIVLLIFSIKLVSKTFSGNIILEIPFSRKTEQFSLTRQGTYSIWHKGKIFTKAPLDEFRPVIIDNSTSEEVRLTHLLFRPNINIRKTSRMEIFRFKAPAGDYLLTLAEGSGISGVENALINKLPFGMTDQDSYFIQVRESQPFIVGLAGIVLIVISGFCIIGGLVIGILADQIFVK